MIGLDPRYLAFRAELRAEFPESDVREKTTAPLMRAIAALFFFAPEFLEHKKTTIGFTVYVPHLAELEVSDPAGLIITLRHEREHMRDLRRLGRLPYSALYLFPQVLAPLALLAPLGLLWAPLWGLGAFVLAAAPWPAPGRVWAEKRGYAETIRATRAAGRIPNLGFIASQFTSWSYYRMSWSGGAIRRWVRHVDAAAAAHAGAIA